MGFAPVLDAPFYTGVAVNADTPFRYDVSLGGHGYVMDPKDYRRRTLEMLRQPQESGPEPADTSLTTEGLWRRAQVDWSLGAGQDWYDDPESNRVRYRAGRGVNPWTKRQLGLLNDTSLISASAATGQLLISAGGFLWWATGTTLSKVNPATNAVTAITNLSGTTITSLSSDGASVYVATATDIRTVATAATAAVIFSATSSTLIRYVNGRLLGLTGRAIVEYAAAGTTTAVFTHPNPNFVWGDACSSPYGIYLAGSSGDHGEAYNLTVNTSTGALGSPTQLLETPSGESINTIRFYAGVVLVGTSLGIRLAQYTIYGVLHLGALVSVGSVKGVEPQGEFCWYTLSNFTLTSHTAAGDVTDTATSGLGRIRLSRFVDVQGAVIPANASDLQASVGGTASAVASGSNKRWFTIDGSGLWSEAATKVATGTYLSGRIYYGTAETKLAVGADVRHDPLNGTVTTSAYTDATTFIPLGVSNLAGSSKPVSQGGAANTTFEWIELQMVLTRSTVDTTQGPVVRRLTLRSLPSPQRTEEILVPLIMRTEVDTKTGERVGFDVGLELSFLRNLVASAQVVTYQEGTAAYTVKCDRLEVQPERFADGLNGFDGIVLMRLLTVEVT